MTTRRNFIKGIFSGLVGLSIVGNLDKVLFTSDSPQEITKTKLYYSVSGARCKNPCGEIMLFGEDRKSAQEYALYNNGIVNYSGTLNGKKVEGGYRMTLSGIMT